MGWVQMSCKHSVVGAKTTSNNQVCRLAMSSSCWRFVQNPLIQSNSPLDGVINKEVKFQLEHETKTDPHLLRSQKAIPRLARLSLLVGGGHSGSAPASSHVWDLFCVFQHLHPPNTGQWPTQLSLLAVSIQIKQSVGEQMKGVV